MTGRGHSDKQEHIATAGGILPKQQPRLARNGRSWTMRLVAFLAATSLFLAFVLPSAAQDQTTGGIIEGQLVNLTKGGGGLANQTVTLRTSRQGTETGSATARTDASGKFQFKGLNTGKDYSYTISMTFQGAEYSSDTVAFTGGETVRNINLEVYDSTGSDQGLKFITSHTIFAPYAKNMLSVTELYIISNSTDQAFVGSGPDLIGTQKKTLTFSLPSGATGFEYGSGLMECCVIVKDGQLIDTMPVFPGEKQVIFSYLVKARTELDFSKSFSLPIDRYDIVVRGEGVRANSDRLIAGEPLFIDNALYSHFVTENVGRGESVSARFSNMPQVASQSFSWPVVVLIAAMAAGAAVAYPVWRRRRLAPATAAVPGKPARDRRQDLLLELAELDDQFEQGKIPEDDYRRRRQEKKRLLAGLMHKGKMK